MPMVVSLFWVESLRFVEGWADDCFVAIRGGLGQGPSMVSGFDFPSFSADLVHPFGDLAARGWQVFEAGWRRDWQSFLILRACCVNFGAKIHFRALYHRLCRGSRRRSYH